MWAERGACWTYLGPYCTPTSSQIDSECANLQPYLPAHKSSAPLAAKPAWSRITGQEGEGWGRLGIGGRVDQCKGKQVGEGFEI